MLSVSCLTPFWFVSGLRDGPGLVLGWSGGAITVVGFALGAAFRDRQFFVLGHSVRGDQPKANSPAALDWAPAPGVGGHVLVFCAGWWLAIGHVTSAWLLRAIFGIPRNPAHQSLPLIDWRRYR